MTDTNFYENQAEQRNSYLEEILKSNHPRKLIVAGPGTGKTFTFGEVFKKLEGNNNLTLTFIRRLVEDMGKDLDDLAEVKTFHAYCKKLLHERNGRIKLIPYLTKIIEKDTNYLGYRFSKFDEKFQTLDERSPEIGFYIARGNYYDAVSFNDSVYRLYRFVHDGHIELPTYNLIVVDEYQDFNLLEVALIRELEKKSPILIVGDDDQAVYIGRNSSPNYLRENYNSGNYQIFQLPFCSRCPKVIVEATSEFIQNVVSRGGLQNRIERPFIPFLEGKKIENLTYPKIIKATTSNIACLSKFIISEIQKIPPSEIAEAHEKGYPCVLVIGKRQYLNPIEKKFKEIFSNTSFTQMQDIIYTAIDAYELLRQQDDSNLGWRILAELEFSDEQMRELIKASQNGMPLLKILNQEFIEKHMKVINILKAKQVSVDERNQLRILLGTLGDQLFEYFYSIKEEEKKEIDKTQATILLSSFEGCKGLSAGHVFIVGLNNGIVPKVGENGDIADIEYCKFIVALTRTLKRCYLLSTKWDYSCNVRPFSPSFFTYLMPKKLLDDKGYIKSKDISP